MRRVRLTAGAAGATKAASTMRAAREALGGAAIAVHERGGAKVDVGALALADFHVLRVVAIRLGVLGERRVGGACENCGRPFRVRPSSLVELAPYLDDELDDDAWDAPFDFEAEHETPPIEVAGRVARAARLRPVTVGEAEALLRDVDRGAVRFTAAVVRAMGLASLGDERDPVAIARALEGANDEAFSGVVSLFDRAHYGARLAGTVRCRGCGARTPVDAPARREFPAIAPAVVGELEGGFRDEFFALVRRASEGLLERRRATDVVITVDEGVAACDEGGTPLLGSYLPGVPPAPGEAGRPPEVTIYARTFRAALDDDPTGFDLADEVRETLEHELDHHDAFLRGDDPEDERERGEVARDERRAVGETETLRRGARALRGEVADFAYRTWPLWALLVLVGLLLARR